MTIHVIKLGHTIMTRNYDINIWDELSYETGGKETGGWKMNFYTYPAVGAPYGNGPMVKELDLYLTAEEAEQLTLGWAPELGGDYCEDEDFWLDVEGFKETYKNIPDRILNHFNNLPEYEQSVEPWDPGVQTAFDQV